MAEHLTKRGGSNFSDWTTGPAEAGELFIVGRHDYPVKEELQRVVS